MEWLDKTQNWIEQKIADLFRTESSQDICETKTVVVWCVTAFLGAVTLILLPFIIQTGYGWLLLGVFFLLIFIYSLIYGLNLPEGDDNTNSNFITYILSNSITAYIKIFAFIIMICIALAESDKSSSSSSSTSHYDEDNDDERSNTNSTVSDSAASETYDAYEVYYSSSVAPNIVSHNEIHSPHQPSVAEAKSVVERMGWNVHGGDVVIRSIEFKHRGCHYASKGQKPFNAV